MKRVAALLCLVFFGMVLGCLAGPIDFTASTSGIFVNPKGGADMNITGVGTNVFTWGNAPLTGPSSLAFEGADSVNADLGSEFKLGTLTFFNGITDPSTNADSVDLQLSVELTFRDPVTAQTIQTLMLVNTPNDQIPNSDQVAFSDSWPTKLFTVGDTAYRLQLLGFYNALGEKLNSLDAWENDGASAELWANVTAVPELPSSGVLLGLGLLFCFLFSAVFQRFSSIAS